MLLIVLGAPQVGAQPGPVPLPFDLVDLAADPLSPDFCGVDFSYVDLDPTSHEEAAGVSLADFDGDGLLDIFLPQNKGAPNGLYHNLGGFQFTDVAAALGVDDPLSASSTAIFFDYDHDGDLDLFVLQHMGKPTLPLGPRYRLFRNSGAAGSHAFTDVTPLAGFIHGPTAKASNFGWASGVCAGDTDQDGWTDLFVSWHGAGSSQDQWRLFGNVANPANPDPGDPASSPRIFVDRTVGSGLEGEFGGDPWQPRFWDANRDGWPDLHIAHDFTLDLFYRNNGNGTFTNIATAVGLNGDPPEFRNEMGIALGDPDNDLDHDLHLTNVGMKDRFYRNDSVAGALAFTDIAVPSGLHDSIFGWGTVFTDLDNDGDVDHAAVTGFEHDTTLLYSNPVHINLFPVTHPVVDGVQWFNATAELPGFSRIDTLNGDSARGLAAGDLDNDGDMDLVVTRNHDRVGVFRNTLRSENLWLQVDLVEAGGHLDLTGARIYLRRHGLMQFREVFTGSSYLCQEPARLHFGLGKPGPAGTVPAFSGPPAVPVPSGFEATGSAMSGRPTTSGDTPGLDDGHVADWLVVRWPDGACQIVKRPKANTIHLVTRSPVDDRGDMNADGHLTAEDEALLFQAILDPVAFVANWPDSPGLIVGDIDDNGVLDLADLAAWALLPPH